MGVLRRPGGRRLATSVAIGLAAALLAVSCGGSGSESSDPDGVTATTDLELVREPPSAPQSGGTLRFGLGAETTSGWDPASSQWGSSGRIVSQTFFDRLTTLDEDNDAQPYLAESLTPNADFTSWTIRLRPGITFHNGEPLDATALQMNLARLPKSVLLADFKMITAVEIVDDLTVRVDTSEPWSTLPYSLTSQGGAIAAPEQLNSATPSEHPIGTGPFVFDTWERDRNLIVRRNPTYWRTDADGGALPYLDAIEFSVLAEPTTRTATMDQGGVDIIESFDPNQIKHFTEAAERGEVQMFSNRFEEAAVQFVGFNTATAPFDDLLARRLVTAAWDPQVTSDTVYLGLFPKADGMFPATSIYHADQPPPGYDPELALELSAEYQAKYGHRLAFSLNLPSTPEFRAVGELAQEQSRQFGIDLELNLLKEADLISAALLGTYEASGLVTFGEPWIDAVFISPNTVAPVGQIALNFTRLADPEIGAALDAIRSTTDTTAQADQWKLIQAQLAENQNVVFVVRNRRAIIYANDVFGLNIELPTGQMGRSTTQPYLTETWIAA